MSDTTRTDDEAAMYRDQYHDARLEVAALQEKLRTMRLALENAQAAMWDAHYGQGIAVEYAQSVDEEIRAALK
jgi:hypothetical protein